MRISAHCGAFLSVERRLTPSRNWEELLIPAVVMGTTLAFAALLLDYVFRARRKGSYELAKCNPSTAWTLPSWTLRALQPQRFLNTPLMNSQSSTTPALPEHSPLSVLSEFMYPHKDWVNADGPHPHCVHVMQQHEHSPLTPINTHGSSTPAQPKHCPARGAHRSGCLKETPQAVGPLPCLLYRLYTWVSVLYMCVSVHTVYICIYCIWLTVSVIVCVRYILYAGVIRQLLSSFWVSAGFYFHFNQTESHSLTFSLVTMTNGKPAAFSPAKYLWHISTMGWNPNVWGKASDCFVSISMAGLGPWPKRPQVGPGVEQNWIGAGLVSDAYRCRMDWGRISLRMVQMCTGLGQD